MSNNNSSSMSDFDFQSAGKIGSSLMNLATVEPQYKMQIQDINAKIDTLKLGYITREAERQYKLNDMIANLKVSSARRGLATGTETVENKAINQIERKQNEDLINTLNRERALEFQKEVAEFNKDMQEISSIVDIGVEAAKMYFTGGMG